MTDARYQLLIQPELTESYCDSKRIHEAEVTQ